MNTDTTSRTSHPTSMQSAGYSGLKSNIGPSLDATRGAAMDFFNQDNARRSSEEPDMTNMDDVQFSASLDALLNGDQMSLNESQTNSNNIGQAQSQSGQLGVTGMPQHQQFGNSQFMAGSDVGGPQQQALGGSQNNLYTGQQRQIELQGASKQQAAASESLNQQQQVRGGLPLISTANQGVLQFGPHSAAQMSLSAGHAAATGAFHPGGGAHASTPVQGLPQMSSGGPPQQSQQGAFPWPITSSTLATLPQQRHHHRQENMSNAGNSSTSGVSAITTPSGISSHPGGGGRNDSNSNGCSSTSGTKRRRSRTDISASAVSEDKGERERRRQDRNMREQERSHRITEQVAHLRDVLSSANVQFKPDKYSTLTKVVEYIKQLQDKSKMLDAEHQKLLNTITETNEIVNNHYVPAYASGSEAPPFNNDLLADGSASPLEDEAMVYVRGIDYKIAFKGCGIPLALASIDGRFLDCNDTFLELTGYSRQELLPCEQPGETNVSFSPLQNEEQKKNLSLFNLLSRDGMQQVFVAMSQMLKQPGSIGSTERRDESSKLADFWSGPVKLGAKNDLPVKLNVTLVRTNRGRPKFFNCALTALGEQDVRLDDQTSITNPSRAPSASDTTASGGEQVLPPAESVGSNTKRTNG